MKRTRLLIRLSVLCLSAFICFTACAQDDMCRSVQDVISVIRDHARVETASFSVSCDEATYTKLRADSDAPLREAVHQGGVQSFGGCRIIQKGTVYTFTFSSVTYYEEYTVCASLDEVRTAVGKYRLRGTPSFSLVCSAGTYSTMESKDKNAFWFMMHSYGIDSGSVSYGDGCYSFSGVTYLGSYAVCGSLEDAKNAVSQYVSGGVSSFGLVCSPELFQSLEMMDDGAFWRIWRSLGIDQTDVSCSTCCYKFSNTTFIGNTAQCNSLQDVRNAISGYARDQVTDYALICGTGIYRQLSADDFSLLRKLCTSCGIYLENFSHSDNSCMIFFKGVVYYPGYRVFRMYETGKEAFLDADERLLLKTARQIVARAGRYLSPLETEKYLHDYLCRNVTYCSDDADGFSVYDTAAGALLYGLADCDGYADAFCLLCSLADIPVQMVSGYADNDGVIRETRENSHAWNLVSLDGGSNWYMVDVTWDDSDSDRIYYMYFNMGSRMASYSRVWKESALSVNWAANENDRVSYYGGMFDGRSFSSPAEAAAFLLRSMSGDTAVLDAKISGIYDSKQINSEIWNAIEESGKYGNWSYGCERCSTVGNVTYAVLSVRVK